MDELQLHNQIDEQMKDQKQRDNDRRTARQKAEEAERLSESNKLDEPDVVASETPEYITAPTQRSDAPVVGSRDDLMREDDDLIR